MSRTHDVIMWGDTGSGKSTLLAAFAFALAGQRSWLDGPRSAAALCALQPIWRDLSESRLPAGTLSATELSFADRAGHMLRFRDMVGGASGGVALPADDVAKLAAAHALLLVMEWPSPEAARNIISISAALAQFPTSRPIVLVLSKVETFLPIERARAFNARDGRVDEYPLSREALAIVERVGWQRTFAVSVYGYRDRRPASMLDEFARIVPCGIQPYAVEEPLDRIHADLAVGAS